MLNGSCILDVIVGDNLNSVNLRLKFKLPWSFLAHRTRYDKNQHRHEICLIILSFSMS
jgi:hypothetical protein